VNLFLSHTLVIVARFVAFISGSLLVVLLLAGVYDEGFFFKAHLFSNSINMVLVMGILGTVLATARKLIPANSFVFEPEK
jgi:hypothetical protein